MRVLVTGGRGQLGATLGDHDGRDGHVVVALGRDECDVTDPASVRSALAEHRPDAVVNCAAWTRVDDAEVEEHAAWALNAEAPRILAEACAETGALLTHLSTDYVVPGDGSTPIDESQPPSPRSAYGRGKLAGEEAVRAMATRHQVVRTSWLYGRDGPNFVLTMLRLGRAGTAPRVVADQTGAPTWTGHLAPALLRLVERGPTGTFHLTNSGSTTWHGFANAIFAAAAIDVTAEPITTAEYPTRAQRPSYSVLDNAAWRRLGEAPLPPWQEGLSAYIEELRARGRLAAP
jgi:dTDP-4-dehydrorhamnose reductase